HWLTVMAPAQVIEPKDLPPEVTTRAATEFPAAPAAPPHVPEAVEPAAVVAVPVALAPLQAAPVAQAGWEDLLEREAQALLAEGRHDVWDVLVRRFESRLILTALHFTRGRRIEAAQKLGIGRNTITRKIAELD